MLSTEGELYVPCFSVCLYCLYIDQHKERVLSSVENWEGVLADVDTLKSGSWMGQSCMNWYLLKHLLERKGTTKVIYLNHRFISRMQHLDPLDDEERWMILQSLGF